MRPQHDTPYLEIEKLWHERRAVIPFLTFPKGWEIKIIPPFGGATARFACRLAAADSWADNSKAPTVSVYLDFDHALGYYGSDMVNPEPYWEMYPAADGDTRRFALADTEGLLGAIALSLQSRIGEKKDA